MHDGRAVHSTVIALDRPLDLARTLGLLARGAGDPPLRVEPGRVWRATRTPSGPATLLVVPAPGRLELTAWGPGAEALLAGAGDLVGLGDDPAELRTPHPLVRALQTRFAAVRLPRTWNVVEALVPAILEQRVTGAESRRAYRRLVVEWGEPAPGPGGLFVPPTAETLARLPYHAFHRLGVERRRAEVVRHAMSRADRLEEIAARPLEAARDLLARRLGARPGLGPWPIAEVGRRAFGDPDAVSVGDFHLPHLVAWALAGEPRGTDARMLELLAPFTGLRGRVVRLLELRGLRPPRFGPRLPVRRIERI